MIDDVVLAVPEMLQALYVLPTSRPPADPGEWLADAVERIEPPVRDLVRHVVDAGLLGVEVRGVQELPPWPVPLLAAFGAGEGALALVTSASHAVVVQAWFHPGWPPLHEWSARAVAVQFARRLDVPVFDAFTPRLVDPQTLAGTLPASGRTFRMADWLVVPQSGGPAGTWLTTKGLGRFGLPELQAVDVPAQLGGAWTNLLTGLASRLLSTWSRALDARTGEPPAFLPLPGEIEVGEADVAQAYGRRPEHRPGAPDGSVASGGEPGSSGGGSGSSGGGSARIALRLDPSPDLEGDVFLTVLPPPEFAASAGEFLAQACARVFGGDEPDIRYVASSPAMERAMAVARAGLPQARRRLLEGGIPLGAQLIVKHRLDVPEGGAEYVWAFVTAWPDPDRLAATCADDAEHDPAWRAGRPVRIGADTVVDWAIWVDGRGIVEGGFTNAVLFAE